MSTSSLGAKNKSTSTNYKFSTNLPQHTPNTRSNFDPNLGPGSIFFEEMPKTISLNVTVVMLDRRTALLRWWPRDALIHKDIEIVFTPEYSK